MQPTKVDRENSIAQELITGADSKTIKRAEWEAFEFELEAPGIVRVTNESYADPDEHSYLVNVEDNVPVACECPAFRHQDGSCKHLVAVAIREPVLQAAQNGAQPMAMADGGIVVEDGESDADGAQALCDHPSCERGKGKERPELCFPCWREVAIR